MSTDLFISGEAGEVTALRASACRDCARVEFPARPACPACGSVAETIELRGPATLRVSTAVLAPPPGGLVEAPYGVGVAEFPEGVCVIGLLVDAPLRGASVDVVVHEPYEGGRFFAYRERPSG